MAVGIPDSWDTSVAISNVNRLSGSSVTWSPCGQFVAVRTREAVEIQDALTFGLLFTLQPAEPTSQLSGGPAYSPDGHCLACTSTSAIIIWDIQTGGEAKRIQCDETINLSPVWSLDGRMISTVVWGIRNLTVRGYDVASGTALPPVTLKSQDEPRLWAHDQSFRVMVTAQPTKIRIVDIFKAGPAQTKTKSFTIRLKEYGGRIESFSPTTHRISVSIDQGACQLRVLDVENSRSLLDRREHFTTHCFSPDGSHFAASMLNSVHVWRYNGNHYTTWRKLPSLDSSSSRLLLFSPTSSSILGYFADTRRLWRLDGPFTAHVTRDRLLAFLSRSGTYVATARRGGHIITIINLRLKTSPRLINAGMGVERLALTDNVLMVMGSTMITTWRLTEEGAVYGAPSNRTSADYGDNICTVPLPQNSLGDPKLFVEDRTGIVGYCGGIICHIYDTRTGEVRELAQVPLHPESYFRPPIPETLNYFQDNCMYDNPTGDSWDRPTTGFEGGGLGVLEGNASYGYQLSGG